MLLYLVLGLFLPLCAADIDVTNVYQSIPTPASYFTTFLAEKSFNPPDFDFTDGDMKGSISEVECRILVVDSLSSTHGTNPVSLSLTSTDTFNCTGQWSYTDGLDSGNGALIASLGKSPLDTEVTITTSSHGFPKDATASKCDIKATLTHSAFFGLTSAQQTYFEDQLKTHLASNLPTTICAFLDELTSGATTDFETIDATMLPYVSKAIAPSPDPIVESGMTVWPASILEIISAELSLFMSPGQCLSAADITNKLTHGTGTISGNAQAVDGSPLLESVLLPGVGVANISVGTYNLTGVDTISSISILYPKGNYSFHTDMVVDSLELSADVTVTVHLHDSLGGGKMQETLRTVAKMGPVHLNTTTLVAIRTNFTQMRYSQITGVFCVLNAINKVNFTYLKLDTTLQDLEVASLSTDIFQQQLDGLTNTGAQMIVTSFKKVLEDVLTGVIAGPYREQLNEDLGNLFGSAECPPAVVPSPSYIMDWTSELGIVILDWILNVFVGSEGKFNLNTVIDCFLDDFHLGAPGQSGSFHKSGTLFKIEDPGKLIIRAHDLYMGPIGSFYNLTLIKPISSTNLMSDITWGHCDESADDCKGMMINMTIDIFLDEGSLHDKESFEISFQFKDFRMYSDLKVLVDGGKVNDLFLTELLDLNCFIATADSIQFEGFDLSMDMFDIHFKGNGSVAFDLALAWDVFGPKISKQVTDEIIPGVGRLVDPLINPFLSGLIYESYYKCRGEPVPDDKDDKLSEGTIVAIAVGASASVTLLAAGLYWRKRRKPTTPDYLEPMIQDGNEEGDDELTPFLIFHPVVPTWLRIAVPITVAAAIGMFLWANISVGAAVKMQIKANGEVLNLFGSEDQSLFEFNLASSIRDMWNAGVYPLALLIAICSGGWPYLKMVLLLWAWVGPYKIRRHRERLLMWLDALGKWSLVDAYVLCLMMVAFHLQLPLTIAGVDFDINIIVEPGWGFYGFLLAAIISLCLTHVIMSMHRRSVRKEVMASGGPKEALRQHEWRESSGVCGCIQRTVSRMGGVGSVVVILLLLASLFLISVGSDTDSFRFEFQGLIGWILYILNIPAERSYSLLSVADHITEAVPSINPGIVIIQISYVTFAMAIPLLHLLLCMILWMVPLTLKMQHRLFVACEIANAWAAMEVFIISIIAALVELNQFAQFIINDKIPDFVNTLIAAWFDTQVDGDDHVFDVRAYLDDGCWLVFSSALLALIAGQIVMRACSQSFNERLRIIAAEKYQSDTANIIPGASYLHSVARGSDL